VRLLVIGGTRFVGRHIVAAALAAGHEVTLFHRGAAGEPFPAADHRHGDRDADLSALADGTWDATVDVCAYVPRQVRALGDTLGLATGRGGRYVLVSSISAYADVDRPGITEDAPLAVLDDEDAEEVTAATYGGLKALCEYAAVEVFGTQTLVVRPTYVVGPHDPTGRWTSWVRRFARGGEVLAAGPRDQPVQVVDARDLAGFVVRLVESGASGAVHVAGPRPPWSLEDLLDQTRAAVAPAGTTITWVDPRFAVDEGVTPSDLPLWHGGEVDWVGAVDPSAALARGLVHRPLAESAHDVLAAADVTPLVAGVGLTAEREAGLLARWHGRGGSGPGRKA